MCELFHWIWSLVYVLVAYWVLLVRYYHNLLIFPPFKSFHMTAEIIKCTIWSKSDHKGYFIKCVGCFNIYCEGYFIESEVAWSSAPLGLLLWSLPSSLLGFHYIKHINHWRLWWTQLWQFYYHTEPHISAIVSSQNYTVQMSTGTFTSNRIIYPTSETGRNF